MEFGEEVWAPAEDEDDEEQPRPLCLLRCYTGQDAQLPRPYSETQVDLYPDSVVAVTVADDDSGPDADADAADATAAPSTTDDAVRGATPQVRCWVEYRDDVVCVVPNLEQHEMSLLINGRPLTRPRVVHAGDRLVFMRTAAAAAVVARALVRAGHGTYDDDEQRTTSQIVAVFRVSDPTVEENVDAAVHAAADVAVSKFSRRLALLDARLHKFEEQDGKFDRAMIRLTNKHKGTLKQVRPRARVSMCVSVVPRVNVPGRARANTQDFTTHPSLSHPPPSFLFAGLGGRQEDQGVLEGAEARERGQESQPLAQPLAQQESHEDEDEIAVGRQGG